MNEKTKALLNALEDSVQTNGFTQNLSMFIQHKMNDDDRRLVINDLSDLMSNSKSE